MLRSQGITPPSNRLGPKSVSFELKRNEEFPTPSPKNQSAPSQTPQRSETYVSPQKRTPQKLILCTPSLDQILKAIGPTNNQRDRTRSSSIVTNPYEEPAPNEASNRSSNKPRGRSGRYSKSSPTPSIKRGKAEKLIKEHGSPPGIRVTAGGRIVPDSLTPINSPLDGTSSAAFKQGQKTSGFAPFPVSTNLNSMPLNGFVVNAGNGNLCQVVDGSLRPVEQHHGTLHLHMPAPNLPVYPDMMAHPYGNPQELLPYLPGPVLPLSNRGDAFAANTAATGRLQPLPTTREVKNLEQAHSQMEQELKDLDRNEVLQRSALTSAQRNEIVRRRVDLVNRIDCSRKAIAQSKRLIEEGSKQGNHGAQAFYPSANAQMHTIMPHEMSLPLMNLQSYAAAAPFQMEQFDQNGYMGAQFQFPENLFAPNAPEFVPKATSGYPQYSSQPNTTLQERVGNIGPGANHRTDGSQGSTDTIKPLDFNRDMSSMNFDGSSNQPRRSRAIEIKRPLESTTKPTPSLNPTSPSYRPINAHSSHPEALAAISTSTLSAAAGNKQYQQPRGRDVSGSNLQDSDTSFSTADFFPTDSYKFSAKKQGFGQRDDQVNLTAWLPKAGENTSVQMQRTPVRPPNKFLFNDESPLDQYFPNHSDENQTKYDAVSQRQTSLASKHSADGMSRPTHLRESTATVESVPRSADFPLQGQPSTLKLLQMASERAAILPGLSPRKSDSYWEGYRVGFHQDILSGIKDEDYSIGYRDGLLHSNNKVNRASFHSQFSSPTPNNSAARHSEHCNRITFMPKAVSFPGLGVPSGSPMPLAPANSLATTPTRSKPVYTGYSSGFDTTNPSPGQQGVVAQLNSSTGLTASRGIGTQTSHSLFSHPPTFSPLADRPSAGNTGKPVNVEAEAFMAKTKGRMEDFERQRYQKSSCSAVQTNTSARACFKARYDGSADDEDKIHSQTGVNVSSPSTPRQQKEKTKMESSGSPIKTKASAAVATMRQFAGIGSKRNEVSYEKNKKKIDEMGSSQPSSPERKRRGEDWSKSFLQSKKHTQ